MTFRIPESLREYYGDVAVRRAVDALIEKLDGAKMPEVGWQEARNYNQALLMAAQVRADLVDLLFGVWEESFGQAKPDRLGEDYYGWEEEDHPLATIWKNKTLVRYYYRDKRPPSADGRSEGLGVEVFGDQNLRPFVVRYAKGDTVAEPGAIAETEGWESTHQNLFDSAVLVNHSVDVRAFLHDPCPALVQFRKDAHAVVDALRQD